MNPYGPPPDGNNPYGPPPNGGSSPFGQPGGSSPYGPPPAQSPWPQAPQTQQGSAFGQPFGNAYAPPAQHSHALAIRCPDCGQPTTSLKQYVLCNLLVFIWVGAFTRRGTYTACPGCMRKIILTRTAINLIPANLLWFIVVLPWHSVQFARTFADGHSDSVRNAIG